MAYVSAVLWVGFACGWAYIAFYRHAAFVVAALSLMTAWDKFRQTRRAQRAA